MEVALLSELEFKHQMTRAWGWEGGGVGGCMRALRCRGVLRTGSGMEGGKGEVWWRVGDGRADKGPVV